MLLVDNRRITDPALNLALDEYLVRHVFQGEELLVCYVNSPVVVIGRHQNALEEVDARYLRTHGIPLLRRISGGGAVYHDPGNLNFGLVSAYRPERFNRYEELTRPLLEVLKSLGVPAVPGRRNDIAAAGQKLSGSAQFASRTAMLSHGTLLVSASLERLRAALAAPAAGIESRSIKSVRSEVANVNDFLAQPIAPEALRELVLARIFGSATGAPRLQLDDEAWQAVRELADRRYRAWTWNVGESPPFTVLRSAGGLSVRLEVARGGAIESAAFGGLPPARAATLEQALAGVRYAREELALALGPAGDATLLDLVHP